MIIELSLVVFDHLLQVHRHEFPWRFAYHSHVLHHLAWEFSQQLLCQKVSVHVHVSERNKLNDVSRGFDSVFAIKSLVSIQTSHILEICAAYAHDDDRERQMGSLNDQIDGSVHVMNGSIGQNQQSLISIGTSFFAFVG
jgi:hypothetical protein